MAALIHASKPAQVLQLPGELIDHILSAAEVVIIYSGRRALMRRRGSWPVSACEATFPGKTEALRESATTATGLVAIRQPMAGSWLAVYGWTFAVSGLPA